MVSLSKLFKERSKSISFIKTTSILLFLFLHLSLTGLFAQAPGWSWAYSAENNSNNIGRSICNDNSGNIYTLGEFSESITFGNTTLTNLGGDDIFLVKYNNQGNVIWAKSFEGTASDFAKKVIADANGNLIITGAFRSASISFGSVTLTNPNSGNGYNAYYLVKINPDGDVIWASTANSDGNCSGIDMEADSDGNIITTGSFDGVSTTFGTITLTNTYQFFSDIFIVKYNASGDILWAQSFGGNSNDYGSGIATGSDGKIYLIGLFESPSIDFGVTTFTNSGGIDYFIVHFNSQGNIIWLRNAIGDGDDMGRDIETDNNGNIFVTGTYSGSSVTFELEQLPGNGYDNIFILKYNSGGNISWAQSASGAENDEAYALTLDNDGNVLITGEFESNPLTFNGATPLTNSSPDYSDIFIVKINTEGIVNWALSVGGNDNDYGLGITTTIDGNAYITGGFYSTSILFGSTLLSNPNNNSVYFIAKLNSLTGISETQYKINSFIYPNPVKDQFNVKVSSISNIEVRTMSGQVVLATKVSKTNNSIDVSELILGFYIVKLYTDKGILIDKMVIE